LVERALHKSTTAPMPVGVPDTMPPALLGRTPAMTTVYKQIAHAASADAPVLIIGESGTGKELVARAIHQHGNRSGRPFVPINCAAIPEQLLESELFGYLQGAFTDARKDKKGLFIEAQGGTLFLDEVGEIPIELQSKLLRVLQEGQFERVGEDRTRQVDVRIIAATNRNLQQEVAASRFRQDLYYRLSVFPITVPPLRERNEDIPMLAEHFIERTCARLNCPLIRITPEQIKQLQRYDWPGNIRELQNVIERAVILARGGVLQLELMLLHGGAEASSDAPIEIAALTPTRVIREEKWKERERTNILAALKQAGGKIYGRGGAAELLGVKPNTLAYRMKVLEIRKKRF
ncbi:MAG: sigma-54 interaction domain-containing protein, partial [bacterium]